MLSSIGIIIISIFITLYELPQMVKKKLLKEIMFFFLLLILGTCLSIFLALKIQLPNPVDWLIHFVKPFSNWIDSLLT